MKAARDLAVRNLENEAGRLIKSLRTLKLLFLIHKDDSEMVRELARMYSDLKRRKRKIIHYRQNLNEREKQELVNAFFGEGVENKEAKWTK